MYRRGSVRRALLGLAIALGVGCEGPADPATIPVRVAAVSELQYLLPALARRFTDETKVAVSMAFGTPEQLVEQIKGGARYDVVLGGGRPAVDGLAAAGWLRPASVRPYARGVLTVAVHHDPGLPIENLADLARREVSAVALADPATAPFGAAGRQALERSGLWPAVSPKVVPAATDRQAFLAVRVGRAEAGLVDRAVVGVSGYRYFDVDTELYDPIVRWLGVVAKAGRPADAEAFAGLVLSEDGQALLAENGFGRAEPGPPAQPVAP